MKPLFLSGLVQPEPIRCEGDMKSAKRVEVEVQVIRHETLSREAIGMSREEKGFVR